MVVGDLHGNLENFKRLLYRARLGDHPGRHLVLQEVIHGPFRYPTGGDKSHQLLDLIAALKCQFPRQVHFLLGNHELAQWTNQRIAKGDVDFNEVFREGITSAYGEHADIIYEAYLDLFAAASLALRTPNRVFLSHSLPSARRLECFNPRVLELDEPAPEELRLGGTVHALVWGRDISLANAVAFLQEIDADWLITGHIPCEQGFDAPHDRQIILDAGGAPACYCLFPIDRAVTHQDLLDGIGTL
jgi:hypothetical protein